ncbi:hypothetical protein AB0M48_26445 [Lentzea sp. NPDC051208]|uniref:hypothetical protein n=1 Tax=Lentzea sp. NPDC051208 TaxID=3154642 RepID=UPI003432B3D6
MRIFGRNLHKRSAVRVNSNKRGIGPITRLLMPLVMKTVGKTASTRDQNYRIDWDAQVSR